MKNLLRLSLICLCGSAFADSPAPITDLGQGSVENRISRLERMMKARQDSLMRIVTQLEELDTEVSALRGATEEHNYKLQQIIQRQRELFQEIENRVSELSKANAQPVVAVSPGQYEQASLTEKQAYDRAVGLILKDKRYDQAIVELRAFLQQNNESVYAPNAYYWLGQLYFIKKEYPNAKKDFEQVVNFYPDSQKRGEAIYKLGEIANLQGNVAKATQLYEQVLSEYPDSSVAKFAKDKLQKIKK